VSSLTRSGRLARIVHVVSIAILLLATIGAIAGEGEDADPFFGILAFFLIAGYTTLGRLIVVRAANPIGWVFLAVGSGVALTLPAEGYVLASYDVPYVASLPGTAFAGWISNLGPALGALAIPMLFLLFPTGRPPTPRWRWVAWLWLAGGALSVIWLMFRPGSIYGERGHFSIDNPVGLPFLDPFRFVLFDVGTTCVFVAAAAAIVSLVVRFRRSKGEERQQTKWLMLVAVAALTIFISMGVLNVFVEQGDAGWTVDDALWVSLVIMLVAGIPVATALAIFRHRLYDVDVVISKTIVYAGLAAFIGAAYVAIVVGVGVLLGGDRSNAALRIAATALVAVAFEPARARLQRFANRLVYGKRATPYEVMAEFGHRMAGVPSPDEVLPDMAEAAARGVGASAARVTLLLPDASERVVTWPEGAEIGLPTFALPVTHAGRQVGEIAVVKPANEPLRPAERALLEDLAGHAGLALHNVRLTADLQGKATELAAQAEELRRSRERLVSARDAQRRRLERELREGVGAELGAIRDDISRDADLVVTDRAAVQASIDALGDRANAALDELRDVARGIFPPLLVEKGLLVALEAHLRKVGVTATLDVDPELRSARLDPAVENAVYFCCVQAVQNAQRHALGADVHVRIEADGDLVRFVVHDDGPGFDPASTQAREGMQIMTDRMAALGGELVVESAPGSGTTIVGRVPSRAMDAVSR
jgi:signal transduction histidine kinase